MQVRVQGLVGNSAVYDQTYVLNTNGPTFINFDYLQVETVLFIPSPATTYEGYFVIDNLSITSTNAPRVHFTNFLSPGQALTIQFEDQTVGR